LDRRSRPDGLYLSVCDDHRLVFLRSSTRSINYSHVIQNEDRCINTDEVNDINRLRGLRNRDRGNEQRYKQK
jgi:hypothetical protein